MLKTFILATLVAITAKGATVTCGTVVDSVSPCVSGDKVFTNFAFLGNVPANGNLEITEVIPNRVYVIDLTGLFTTSFAWAYDVSVNTSICPTCRITNVGYGITGLPSPAPRLQSTFGGFIGSPTNGNLFGVISPPTINLHVVNTFEANGGFATRLSNTLVERLTVPDVPTFLLFGSGLIFLVRKRV